MKVKCYLQKSYKCFWFQLVQSTILCSLAAHSWRLYVKNDQIRQENYSQRKQFWMGFWIQWWLNLTRKVGNLYLQILKCDHFDQNWIMWLFFFSFRNHQFSFNQDAFIKNWYPWFLIEIKSTWKYLKIRLLV